ncbi:MAG TPA: protoporphyrinogen oxidase [Candidatus Krumholzibacteria bacterium]|nr:protoporphyrinogen oxidase [Candidatus Krumholzibacteria bacterium]HPD71180.1 protoporphyrinogen oxidase [Candidatus Krumholzibacteria bacterium]HRY39120.1 protoporphyrinogen oxidase [Candidatus Krumholzibacteria bacterium]
MPDGPLRVAVIGGGVAGLATAWRLEHPAAGEGPACDVTILEAAATVGGNLRTETDGRFRVEWGPNGFLDSEPATLDLARAAGLGEALLRSNDAARRRFLYVRGRLREIPTSPAAFLRCDLFPPAAKLRIAGEVLVPPRRDLGQAASRPETDETVWQFGARRLGRAFAETMLDPMVRGITGGDCRRVSLAAAFPRMVELERDHGGLFRAMAVLGGRRRREGRAGRAGGAGGPTGVLTSFVEGTAALPRALAAGLRGPVLVGHPVTSLTPEPGGWRVTAGGQRLGPFHAVVDAAPAHEAAAYHVDPEARELLAGIRFNPLVVVGLAFRREDVVHPLDGFGLLTPSFEGRPLLGVLWTSSIWNHRAPAGTVLLRSMAGDPAWLSLDDAEIVARTCSELDAIHGVRGRPLRHWVFRHPRAIAEYEVGHLARLARLESILERTPGLFVTGSSYRGIAINACLKDAGRVAARVRAHLAAEVLA